MSELIENKWTGKDGVEHIDYVIKKINESGKGMIVNNVFKGVFRFNPSIKTITYFNKKDKKNKTFNVIECIVVPDESNEFTNVVLNEHGTIKLSLPDCKSVNEAFDEYDKVERTVGTMTFNDVEGLKNHSFSIKLESYVITEDDEEKTRYKWMFELGDEVEYKSEEKSNADDVKIEGYDFPQDKVLEVQKAFDEGKVKADQKININGVETTVSEVLGL